MEYLLLVISGLSLFLIVMSNFKVSRVEEIQKRHEDTQKSINETMNSIISLQKRIFETLNENSPEESAEHAYGGDTNLSVKNELLNMDRKISNIQSILKKMETNRNERSFNDSNVMNASKKTFSIENKLNSTSENSQVKVIQEIQNDIVEIEAKEDRNMEIKFNKFIIKYNNVTEDEKFILNRILKNSPGNWEKIEPEFMKDTTLRFILPMLCRKFIIDGVPLLKMKEIAGSFKVIWGESYPDALVQRIVEYFKDVVK